MLQFYFLSILLNLVTGIILVYGKNLISGESPESKARGILGENAFFDDKNFRLVLGILTVFVGIMKLLSVVRTDVPVYMPPADETERFAKEAGFDSFDFYTDWEGERCGSDKAAVWVLK